jgi:hypothetical protein
MSAKNLHDSKGKKGKGTDRRNFVQRIFACDVCTDLLHRTRFSTEQSAVGKHVTATIRFVDQESEEKYSQHLKDVHKMCP